ncbi:unnamed protein product [Rotaria sp. Silwood1]|nr:unnamed protein product [Rotaria sp. Silwood1]
MHNSLVDGHIRHEFRSILNILIHFSLSLTQLVSVLAILGLQIALAVTQTCAYQFAIGFWSFPFLIMSPISIWLVIWRRNLVTCLSAIVVHFCSTLFATAIIIFSFLVLIGQIGFTCSTSSLNTTYVVLNSSLIGMSGFFKLFNYGELILLYMLIRNHDKISTTSIKEFFQRDHSFMPDRTYVNAWRSWAEVNSETRKNSLYPDPIPKCYIGAGNNSDLIQTILTSIGYEHRFEKKIDNFKLKWIQYIENVKIYTLRMY